MPFGPKNLTISFTGKNVTHFGGVYLLHLFLKRIKLKSLLSKKVFFAQRNNHYAISEVILALIYPIILGFGRIETTHLLKHNGVFQYLTGLPTYPDPQTLRRFLLRMAPLALSRLRRLHDTLLSTMMRQPSLPTRMIFDLDSTVLVLYGKQEMSILTGCTFTTAPIKADMSFSPKIGKIDKQVLLEIPQDTKDYVAKAKYAGSVFEVPLGQAIEPNALTALNSIIQDVAIKKDPQTVDRVIVLSIAEGTGVDLGTFTFSKNNFKTALKCDVKMPDGRVVWSKNVYAESSRERAEELAVSILLRLA